MQYKQVLDLVEKTSRLIGYKLRDVTSFEHTCFINIGKELLSGREIKSIQALAQHYVSRAAARHIKKAQYRSPVFMNDLSMENDDGQAQEFDIKDCNAVVEDNVLANASLQKTTALLAKDDRRKEFVLNAWLVGFTNDSELSFVLADEFKDTKPSGHRSFIKRFRNDCRTLLSSTAI
jgi:hypothetical protein